MCTRNAVMHRVSQLAPSLRSRAPLVVCAAHMHPANLFCAATTRRAGNQLACSWRWLLLWQGWGGGESFVPVDGD